MRKMTIAAATLLFLSTTACDGGGEKAGEKASEAADAKEGDAKEGDAKEGDAKEGDAKEGDAKEGDAKEAAAPADNMLAGMKEWNEGNHDAALARFSDDVKITFAGAPGPMDKAALKKQWADGLVAFPDQKIAASRILDLGDTIVVQFVANGTHKGEFMGNAATDKPTGNNILWVLKQEGGQFTEVSSWANGMAEFTQIGAAPEGTPPYPVPEMPSGDPEVVTGEANEANVELMKTWHKTFLEGNTSEKIGDFIAADAKHHDLGMGMTEEGLEAARKGIGEMTKAFTEVKMDGMTYASVGDYVFVSGKWGAKHTGDMGPMKATNKEFMTSFGEVALLKDGKIVESWSYSNPMDMMMQLGVMEPPAAPGGEGGDK